jgi:hypothetical protein
MEVLFRRKFQQIILLPIIIGLLTFGIKLPDLTGCSSGNKPKPRPRAIIQNQIKSCKQGMEKLCKFAPELGLHQPAAGELPAVEAMPASSCLSFPGFPCLASSGHASRAPPISPTFHSI